MKLRTDIPVRGQIAAAVEAGIPLVCDGRSEAMGDKIALLNLVALIYHLFGVRPTIIESESSTRTPFSLMQYQTWAPCETREDDDILEGMLDLHTLGTGYESLWYLNSYAAINGRCGQLSLLKDVDRSDEIVICLLERTLYNERREMDLRCIAVLEKLLLSNGYSVTVIATAPHDDIPSIRVMSTEEALFQIATAKCVIAGDTGFSHAAAAFRTPLVSVWPDWHQYGRAKLGNAIKLSEWWGLPLYQCTQAFLPNGDPDLIRIVELGTDHRFSTEHVLRSIQAIT